VVLADVDMFAQEIASGQLVMPFDRVSADGFGSVASRPTPKTSAIRRSSPLRRMDHPPLLARHGPRAPKRRAEMVPEMRG
jgi:LysR family glycine cleavage system transcriptional activator